ncbi:2-dehydropantoate 2-reductase [Magnaporthiopsis poae ATCC 64411]|uniref:2-dehydropantoate 2-reductase n=1 Tax=Magnaporthiopsis poae (strain ATCC 64411 / 73-15) TaxID=644358 RepID=A0A0C4E037_MAGP6|nr:2-dehydropantoate 2-reductase [Magnaporthiopsis poae ATCC 64411]
MLQDARAGRETEIDYINGYVVSSAVKLGLPAPVNATLVAMLKRRETATEAEMVARFARATKSTTVSTP